MRAFPGRGTRRMSLVKTAILAAALAGAAATALHAQASTDDPYLWLEEVSSPRAMDWVNAHNAKAQAVLGAGPRYQAFYTQALAIAPAKDRIPFGRFLNGQVYNFWQDSDHVRGIFRRTSLAGYQAETPAWETVLDLDALAASEKANWVYKGADCARPAERRCLINLSDGGEDAVTIREFDLPTGKFVEGGFVIPKGKSRTSWEDENSLLISREWAPGDLGRTGYPFIVKRLKRGQPLASAVEVFRGSAEDGGYGVTPYVLRDGENRTLAVIDRPLDTFRSETYILTPRGPQRVAIPAKANLSDMVAGRVIIETREDWTPAGSAATYPAGALLSVDLAQLKADPAHPRPTLIYAAGPRGRRRHRRGRGFDGDHPGRNDRLRPGDRDARHDGHRRPPRQGARPQGADAEPEARHGHAQRHRSRQGGQGRPGRVPRREGGDHPLGHRQGELPGRRASPQLRRLRRRHRPRQADRRQGQVRQEDRFVLVDGPRPQGRRRGSRGRVKASPCEP